MKGLSFLTKEEYKKLTKKASNRSKILPDCLGAFVIGGGICVLGQALFDLYQSFGLDKKTAGTLMSVSLIFLSILFTGLGLYQKLANFGGAGTLVPITGFANAMSSPAIEFKPEGHVLGIGSNMFKIAGPVIVYGCFASVIYGVVLVICQYVSGVF